MPIISIFICGLFLLPTVVESDNMIYASIEKRNRIKNIDSPKMVFIGGSSMAFGLDSKVVEEKLGYPVVNMGLHAGIGLRYMVLEVAPYLKKGDIVIIGAEYDHFDNSTFYGGEILPILLFDINKDYEKLDFMNTIYLFPEIAHYSLRKVRGFLSYENPNQEAIITSNEPKIY